ncbi:MAG: serine hydrolase [Kaiparowitsia implicata GSE-PSE-MK54-09C]|jgi:CubicO group peptidase (beta-lactamase class C family)|nr:serine hydrolase [Kaiparowitsia implicata GSE-PSE-MK54-09C]
MKRTAIATLVALGLTLLTSNAPASANTIDDPNDVAWASIRGYTSQQFHNYFNQKKEEGYRVIDIEVDEVNGQPRYAAVFQFNTDNRGWASLRDLTHEQFSQEWEDYKNKGYRLIDQEAYMLNGQRRYAGVWVENKENFGWVSYRNVDSAEFGDRFNTYREQGYRMVDVEAYPSGRNTLYAAVWVKDGQSLSWAEHRDMTAAQYGEKFDLFRDQGYRVLDLESYQQNGQQRYAAIWVKNTNGRGWAARRDMTASGFGNWWKTYKDEGYRLVDFESYPTAEGTRYAGVWRQNGDRLSWSGKKAADQAIAAYQNANKVPGISVAIARDGKILYSRGFGYADIANQEVAHAGTVYRLASVSKPITALLTMRLVDLGQLSLNDSTREHVPALPRFHSHTVDHLLRHRSGIRHYKTTDYQKDCNLTVSNTSNWQDFSATQYPTALAATVLFRQDSLLFEPDTQGCYSTHAYTVLGAALEGAGNASFSTLLNRELTQRLDLPTLQPEFLNQSNSERANIYRLSNGSSVLSSRDNLSWKYPGGGLEASAMDMTRLGMKVFDGSVISAQSRNTLWPGSSLSRSGSQNGAKSFWRLYFNDKTVITVLSNQNNGNPGELTETLGTIVKNN